MVRFACAGLIIVVSLIESMNEVEIRSSKQREDFGIEPLLIPPPTPSFVALRRRCYLGLKRDDKPLSPQRPL